jgi:hypothetical protein
VTTACAVAALARIADASATSSSSSSSMSHGHAYAASTSMPASQMLHRERPKMPLFGQAEEAECDFYMSPTGIADASDEDAGSATNPFGSFETSQLVLKPGNVLCVESGRYTYDTFVGAEIVAQGTKEAPIKITGRASAAGEYPKIEFTGAVAMDFRAAEYVTVENIEIDGGAKALDARSTVANFWWANKKITNQGQMCFRLRDKSRHVKILGCACHDVSDNAVTVLDAFYTTIKNNVFYRIGWYPSTSTTTPTAIRRAYTPKTSEVEEDGEYRLDIDGNAIFNVESHVYARSDTDSTGEIVDAFAISLDTVTDEDSRYRVSENLLAFNNNNNLLYKYNPHLLVSKNTIYSDPAHPSNGITDVSDASRAVLQSNVVYAGKDAEYAARFASKMSSDTRDNVVGGGADITGEENMKNVGDYTRVFADAPGGDFSVVPSITNLLGDGAEAPGVDASTLERLAMIAQQYNGQVIGESTWKVNHEAITLMIIDTKPAKFDGAEFKRTSPSEAQIDFTSSTTGEKFTLKLNSEYAQQIYDNGDVSPLSESYKTLDHGERPQDTVNVPPAVAAEEYPTTNSAYPSSDASTYPSADSAYPSSDASTYPSADSAYPSSDASTYPSADSAYPSKGSSAYPAYPSSETETIKRATQDAVDAIQAATAKAIAEVKEEAPSVEELNKEDGLIGDDSGEYEATEPFAIPKVDLYGTDPDAGVKDGRVVVPTADGKTGLIREQIIEGDASIVDLDKPDEDVSKIVGLDEECYSPPPPCSHQIHLMAYRTSRPRTATSPVADTTLNAPTTEDTTLNAPTTEDTTLNAPTTEDTTLNAPTTPEEIPQLGDWGVRDPKQQRRQRRATLAALGIKQTYSERFGDFIAPVAIMLAVVAAVVVSNKSWMSSADAVEERASLLAMAEEAEERSSMSKYSSTTKMRRSALVGSAVAGVCLVVASTTSSAPRASDMKVARAEVSQLGSKLSSCAGKFYIVGLAETSCSVRASDIPVESRPFPLEDYIKFEAYLIARLSWGAFWQMKKTAFDLRTDAKARILQEAGVTAEDEVNIDFNAQCLRTKAWCTKSDEGKQSMCCRSMPLSPLEMADNSLAFSSYQSVLRNICACTVQKKDVVPAGCGQISTEGRDMYCDRQRTLGVSDDKLNKCCFAPNPFRVQECLCLADEDHHWDYR